MYSPTVAVIALLLWTLAGSAPMPPAGTFTYYPMLSQDSGPCDICTGPDGAIWVEDILINKIARVDPATGVVTEYDIPYTTPPLPNALPGAQGQTAFACAIQPGSDGNLYAASGVRNQLVRINPTTKKIDVFTPPNNLLGNLEPFNDLWTGPTGMFFTQTSANVVSHFSYQTQQFTTFPVPTPNSGPLGLIVASDGGTWFTEFLANKIARLNATTGQITEYPVPLSLTQPTVMRAETDGHYLWFTAFVGNAIGRIDMRTGAVTAFPNPSPLSFPTEDTVDASGNIWFSTATQNTLNRLEPASGMVFTVKQPDTIIVGPVSVPPAVDIAVHYGPGNAIWFTEAATNRVGRYQL